MSTEAKARADFLRWLSSKPRADYSIKSLHLGLWHLVAACDVMSRKKVHLLNACFLARLQEPLCTTLWWTEQAKSVRKLARLILAYRSGIVRFLKLESGFSEPPKVRRARIREEGMTLGEPASHPSRSHLGIGPETDGDHEHHWETDQGAARPLGPMLQMTKRCSYSRWMNTDHEKGAVGHLAG
jgi:hypothetical protein